MDVSWLIGLALNLVAGFAAFRGGALKPSGFLSGVLIGTLIWGLLGASGWILFLFFVAGGSLLSSCGYHKKKAMGTAQAEGGRRGWPEALANTGIALAAAFFTLRIPSAWPVFAFAGALATALADTTASELGPLLAPRARHPLTLRPLAAGFEGAISAAGTVAGLVAAGLMAALAVLTGLLPWSAFWILPLAAGMGSWLESVLGVLDLPGFLRRNACLNFINTLVGATLAGAAAFWI